MFLLMEMYELVSRQCRATGLKSRQINYYQFLAKQQQKQQQTMYSLNVFVKFLQPCLVVFFSCFFSFKLRILETQLYFTK
jgi:hypothetical protein